MPSMCAVSARVSRIGSGVTVESRRERSLVKGLGASAHRYEMSAEQVILLHGLGHGGAIAALAWIAARPGGPTGDWHAARSWLMPALPTNTATAVACTFWVLALAGFVAAALALAGLLVPVDALKPLALGSAIVSLAGIGHFLGTWPAFNTLAAIAVNVAVLVALLRCPASRSGHRGASSSETYQMQATRGRRRQGDHLPQPRCHMSPALVELRYRQSRRPGTLPGSRLRIIATLAIANQATQVSWAMYVIQPLAE